MCIPTKPVSSSQANDLSYLTLEKEERSKRYTRRFSGPPVQNSLLHFSVCIVAERHFYDKRAMQ